MTDSTPTEPAAPKRRPAAKTTPAPAEGDAVPVTRKTPAVKAPATKPAVAKTPTARSAAATKPVAAPITPVEAAPLASTTVASSVEATPAVVTPTAATVPPASASAAVTPVTPSARVAPAGWYPVTADGTQQRWWDGAAWSEHVYNPVVVRPTLTAAAGTLPSAALRAPDGTRPDTVWFWLLAIGAPVLQLLAIIPWSVYFGQLLSGSTTDPSQFVASQFNTAYVIAVLSEWFVVAVCVVFAALDWRELKARGIPRPFHWAWSFFVLLVGWPGVYMIGRSIVVRRRTGTGLLPLWIYIGLQVVAFIVLIIVAAVIITQLFVLVSDSLSTSGNVF